MGQHLFGDELLQHAKTITASSWAVIDDISNWPVKPPDEIEMCSEISQKLVDRGLKHFAVCGSKLAVSKWMMEQIVPESIALGYFDTLDECKEWLNNRTRLSRLQREMARAYYHSMARIHCRECLTTKFGWHRHCPVVANVRSSESALR